MVWGGLEGRMIVSEDATEIQIKIIYNLSRKKWLLHLKKKDTHWSVIYCEAHRESYCMSEDRHCRVFYMYKDGEALCLK